MWQVTEYLHGLHCPSVCNCGFFVRHKMATWAVGLSHQLAVGTTGCERACMQQCWCVLACLENTASTLDRRSSGGCLCAQVAQFAAELERYGEAIELYEGIARQSVDNNLLKYSAKGYLLNAGICQLCSALCSRMRDTSGPCLAMTVNVDFLHESLMLALDAMQMPSGVLFKLIDRKCAGVCVWGSGSEVPSSRVQAGSALHGCFWKTVVFVSTYLYLS